MLSFYYCVCLLCLLTLCERASDWTNEVKETRLLLHFSGLFSHHSIREQLLYVWACELHALSRRRRCATLAPAEPAKHHQCRWSFIDGGATGRGASVPRVLGRQTSVPARDVASEEEAAKEASEQGGRGEWDR